MVYCYEATYLNLLAAMKPLFASSILFFLIIIFIAPTLPLSVTIDHHLENYNQMELPGAVGPESIAFDCHGKGPYVGVSDGRILKWQGIHLGWKEFAIVSANRDRELCDGSTKLENEPKCGRPLGLKFNPATCDLYIADAYFGLLIVEPHGGVAKRLATSAEGVPFRFTNALDIDTKTGVVYFTDSSIFYQRRVWLLVILSGDKTGRLMKYDPRTKEVSVLLNGLAFPNGVALSKDNSYLVLAESGKCRILRFWLRGSKTKSHSSEVFAQLRRSPDNITRTRKGEFWVGLNSGREIINNLGRHIINLQNENLSLRLIKDPVATKFDKDGKVVDVLDGNGGNAFDSVSEVEEFNGRLWIGSSVKPYLGIVKL